MKMNCYIFSLKSVVRTKFTLRNGEDGAASESSSSRKGIAG